MAEEGPHRRASSDPAAKEASATEHFDPLAFEERLKEARARRAEAIARRKDAENESATQSDERMSREEPRPPQTIAVSREDDVDAGSPGDNIVGYPSQPRPATPPTPEPRPERHEQSFRQVVPSPVAVPRPQPPKRRMNGLTLALIFLIGLGLGAAAVALAPRDLRERLTAFLDAPETAEAPITAEVAPEPAASAPEPVVESNSATPAPESNAAAPAPEPVAESNPAAPAPEPVAERSVAASPEEPAVAASPEPSEANPAFEPLPLALEGNGPAYLLPGKLARADAAPEPQAQTAAEAEPPPPDLSEHRVFVHFPTGVATAKVEQSLEALRAAGFGSVVMVPARFAISRTNVRYYHTADAMAASAAADILGPELAEDGVLARDFTNFSPSPLPGTLEVWLAGETRGGGGVPAQPAPQEPPSIAPAQILPAEPQITENELPPPATSAPRSRAEETAERILQILEERPFGQ